MSSSINPMVRATLDVSSPSGHLSPIGLGTTPWYDIGDNKFRTHVYIPALVVDQGVKVAKTADIFLDEFNKRYGTHLKRINVSIPDSEKKKAHRAADAVLDELVEAAGFLSIIGPVVKKPAAGGGGNTMNMSGGARRSRNRKTRRRR